MLKVQHNHGNDYQRRPTRFSSSFEPTPQTSTSSRSNHQDLLQSKLNKFSTITRIPPAPSKGCIRPPVDRSSTSNPSNNNNATLEPAKRPSLANSKAQPNRVRPSSLALSGGRAFSSSTSKLTTAGSRVLQRIASRPSRTSTSDSNKKILEPSNKLKVDSGRGGTCEDDQGGKSPTTGGLPSGRQIQRQRQNTNGGCNKQQAASSGSSLQSSELRLVRLKNLVAVVHPQHSQQRVNSTTRINKLTIMKSTAATNTTTKGGKVGNGSYHRRDAPNEVGNANSNTTGLARRTRSESGEESKQDGGQIVARQSGTRTAPPTTTCTTLNATPISKPSAGTTSNTTAAAAATAKQMTSSPPPHYSSCCSPSSSTSPSSSSSCPTSEEEDKSDQFTLTINSNNNGNSSNSTKYLLSVASRNNGDLDDEDRKDQHGNNKQSNKHLLARRAAYPSAPAATTAPASSTSRQNTFCRANNSGCLSTDDNDNNNNNCYRSSTHHGAKSTSLTKTQTSAANTPLKRSTTKASKTTPINNDHLLPKPMGQQVLSLMMLDVGLLPANGGLSSGGGSCSSSNSINHHQHHHQQQQTLCPKPRRSHVRVQSPTREDIIGFSSTSIGNNVNLHLLDNGQSFINHHERDQAAKRLNNHSIDCLEHRFGNDFHSLHQPLPQITAAGSAVAEAHEMMRLQVRLSYQDNENLRSISLPTSPRIGFRAANNNQYQTTRSDDPFTAKAPGSTSRPSPFDPIRLSAHQSSQKDSPQTHTGPTDSRTSCSEAQLGGQQAQNLNEHLISICDNQDSNSLTSSSCSSLNHFPPLLALSNQLGVLRFEELVNKAHFDATNAEQKQQQQDRYLCEKNTRSPSSNCQNSPNSTTRASTSHSFDQADQNAQKQLDELQRQSLEKVSSNHEIENNKKHTNNKEINHAKKCSRQSEDSKMSDSEGYQSKEVAIENTGYTSSNQRYHHHRPNHCTNSQVKPNDLFYIDEGCTEQQLRRQQQRSHSISGQEFHSNGGYHRLKQSLYNNQQQQQQQQQLFDGYQNYGSQSGAGNGRLQQVPSPYQQHQQLLAGRSPSPLSINCPPQYGGSPFRDAKQYPLDPTAAGGSTRLPRNQLHASLECLNTAYPDYHQVQRLQEQHQHQQLLHHQQQQQQQLHNQHYAASYVLAAPPANTIINSNGDQDLAAAAMGTPPSQRNPASNNSALSQHLNTTSSSSSSSYSHQTQNLINRAMAQVSQSPMRRLGLTQHNPQGGASSGLLSHLGSGHHHPMRAGHSSLSLASSSFIIEDKLQNEIRKLQSELKSEKEKNEALNSQLNINSSLMAAFEQSLTTLNTRLRQLTTLNEKKDNEIEDLKEQLRSSKMLDLDRLDKISSPRDEIQQTDDDNEDWTASSEIDNNSERSMMMKTIDDLRRQLIDKDRLLTDTRLEALSAAHQLEQLESKLNGEHSILINEDELDEGVMVVNHSPSDSDAITDSAHFSEINSQISKSNNHQAKSNGDAVSFSTNNGSNNNTDSNSSGNNLMCNSTDGHNITDDHHSNHSSDYQNYEVKENDHHHHQQQPVQQTLPSSVSQQQFHGTDSGAVCKLMDSLLLTN